MIIEGGATNKSFVLDLLDQPEVIDASADTGWIDRVRGRGQAGLAAGTPAIALAAAAIEAYEDEEEVARQRLLATAHGGRPQVQHESGRPLDLKLRGVGYRVSVARIGHTRFRVGIAGGRRRRTRPTSRSSASTRHTGQIIVNGQRYRLVTGTHGPIHLVEVDGVTHRVSRDEGGVVRSPAPALVVATPLAVGDEVEAGAPVLVLESMKMETVLRAPFRARVRELPVSVGSQVETGRRAAAAGAAGRRRTARRRPPAPAEAAEIELPAEPAAASAADRAERGLQDLRSLLLGFDVDPHDQRRALAGYLAARAELGEPAVRWPAEIELLEVFADLSELTRNQPAGEDISAERPVHSAREYFHTYLQSLDVERAGLPETFQGRLQRVLGHYGVADLERTPELEEAVFRIFLAQQRASADVAIVSALLRQWLTEAPPAESLREQAGLALEHLVAATQVRFPAVGDLARGVVFRWFAPAAAAPQTAREVYAGVRKHLRHLDRHPDSPDRAERIAAMVASSEPLVRLLGQRIGRPGTDPAPLLEVLTRRYYGNKDLAGVRSREVAGCTFVIAEHVGAGPGGHHRRRLRAAGRRRARRRRAGRGRPGRRARGRRHLPRLGGPARDADAMAARAGRGAHRAAAARAASAGSPPPSPGGGGAVMHHHFTFRPAAGRDSPRTG